LPDLRAANGWWRARRTAAVAGAARQARIPGRSGFGTATAAAAPMTHFLDRKNITWGLCLSEIVGNKGDWTRLPKKKLKIFTTLITSIKHKLIIKLITRMDGKSQNESIKPN
jgi:hypothetical protein